MSNSKRKLMYATYDAASGCAFIYLDGKIKANGVARTVFVKNEMIGLDFDHEGRLVGIELINGKAMLPKGLCASAILNETLGDEEDDHG